MGKTMSILCSICTRGRYETTLPLTIQSVLMQTKLPDKIIIYDDNAEIKDLRDHPTYRYLFLIMIEKGIQWGVVFGDKKGQHFSHHKANTAGFKWVWRLDDDTIAEPSVLETLSS